MKFVVIGLQVLKYVTEVFLRAKCENFHPKPSTVDVL